MECLDDLDWRISKIVVSGWMLVVSPEVSMMLLPDLPDPGFHCKFLLIKLTTGFSLVLSDNTGHRIVVRIVVGERGCSHSR